MSAHLILDVLVGLVIAVGLVGSIIQIYPGLLLVGGAVLVWGVVTGGTVGWTMAASAILAVVVGMVVKFALAGRYLHRQGVPNRSLVIGAVVGVVGFFMIPFVGLVVGFLVGTWFAEWQRLRDTDAAIASTIAALKATGLSILVELAVGLLLAAAWVAALVVH